MAIDEKVLVERLEEELKLADEAKEKCARENPLMFDNAKGYSTGIANAKYIVNQLAEEMGVSKMENTTWIPCSERLPEEDGKRYIVQKTNGFIDILSFTKDAYKLSRYDFAEYKGKKKQLFYDFDSEYGYVEWECEAWCPLPAPYQPKE